MANFYISAEIVADMCERISIHMEYLNTACSQLHNTLMFARPDKSDIFTDVIKALRSGVKTFAATDLSLIRLSKSEYGMDAGAWTELSSYWNTIRRRVTNEKDNIITTMVEFMRQEVEHLWKYQGLFAYFWCDGYQKIRNYYEEQLEGGKLVLQIDYFLGNFSITSLLFLRHLPQLLNPNIFFVNADGIYYYVTRFFAQIIHNGDVPENNILYRLAMNFINLGPICPKSKLAYPSANACIEAVEEESGEVLEAEHRNYYTLVYTLALNPNLFSEYAKYISSVFENRQVVTFHNRYYALVLFELIVRDIICTVKVLYFKLRRIIYSILIHVCPKEDLSYLVREALINGGVSVYLNDCLEILTVCKKTIKCVKDKSYSYETATRAVYEDGVLAYTSLVNEGPKKCKQDVVEFLRQFYKQTRSELFRETANFLFEFSNLCGRKGINPAAIQDLYRTIHLQSAYFEKWCYQLDEAERKFQEDKVVLIRNVARLRSGLRIAYVSVYNKIDSIPNTGPRINPNAILRLLPMNDELQSIIVNYKHSNIFYGNEPVQCLYSAPVRTLPETVLLDIDSVIIPEEDTLTEEELRKNFNQDQD